MEPIFDKFPSNMGETLGTIPRNPFEFRFSRIEIWRAGELIDEYITTGKITGTIINKILNVNVECERISMYTISQFTLGEISTNNERIMWSKDIFNKFENYEDRYPDIISLFFQVGILSKMSFTIRNPATLIEFYFD